VRDSPLYHDLLRQMRAASSDGLLADLERFVDSFGDHDPDCPVTDTGRDEVNSCTCGFARRFDFYEELRRRLE
jgi:hypothetical protein